MADEELPTAIHKAAHSPMYASQRPVPSWERLNSPSMRVWVKNTSEVQKHMVIDKYYVGHTLQPGERKEMELLNEEIAVFQSHRLPNRIDSDTGLPKPLHAILIEGIPSLIEQEEAQRNAIHIEQARKKRLLELRELKELRELEEETAALQSRGKGRS